jgi:hypothetical protein
MPDFCCMKSVHVYVLLCKSMVNIKGLLLNHDLSNVTGVLYSGNVA